MGSTADAWLQLGLLHGLPLWVLLVLLTLLLMAAHEVGFQARRRIARRKGETEPGDGAGGGHLPAIQALLALLLAFTFAMSVERYNARRALVLDEANAVGSYFRYLQGLDLASQTRIAPVFVRYLDARRDYSAAHDRGSLVRTAGQADALQRQLWTETVSAGSRASAVLQSLVLQAANDMFKQAAARRAANEATVPLTVMRAVVTYAIITALLMGYGLPHGQRRLVASTTQFVLLAIALTLIIDVDRPRTGLIAISQAPLYRIVDQVRPYASRLAADRAAAPRPTGPLSPAP